MSDQKTVSKIQKAIEQEDIETLNEIILNDFGINQEFMINDSKYTILLFAACKNRIKSVEWALSKGADVNFKDQKGNTALMYASNFGHFNVAKSLLTKCSDSAINIQNKNGNTALMLASEYGNTETVKELLTKCSKETINIQNKYGDTALIWASCNGHTGTVKELLDKCSEATINIKNKYGQTALIFASWNGHTEIVKVLLTKCNEASINIQGKDGYTALMCASRNGHTEIQKMITDRLESFKSIQRDYNFLSEDIEQEFIKNDYLIDSNIHREALAYICYKKKWDLVSKVIEKKQRKSSFFLGRSAQEWCFFGGNFELGNRCISQTEDSHTVIDSIRASCKRYFNDDSMINECKSTIKSISIEPKYKFCAERYSLPVTKEQIRLKEIEQQIEQLERKKKKLTEK